MGLAESTLRAASGPETAFGTAARDLIRDLPNATDAELALLESAIGAARGQPPVAAAPQTLISLSDELLLDVAGQLSFASDVSIRSVCRRTNDVLIRSPSRTRAKVMFLAEGTARLREQLRNEEWSLAQAKSELEEAHAENEAAAAHIQEMRTFVREGIDQLQTRLVASQRKSEENTRKIDENARKIDENTMKIDENTRKIDEHEKRTEENQKRIAERLAEVELQLTELRPNEIQKKRRARRAARGFYHATAMRLLRGARARKPTVANTGGSQSTRHAPCRRRRGVEPQPKLDSSVLLALLCAGDTSRTRLVAAQNIDGEARRRSHARKQRRTKGAPRGADFDRKSRSQKRRA